HRHYPGFLTLLVTDAAGDVLTSEPVLAGAGRRVSVADRQYFQAPRSTGLAHVSDAFRGRGHGNDPLVAVSVPLRDGDAFAGVLEGSIPVGALVMRRGGLEEHGCELPLLDRALTVVEASDGMPHRPLDALGGSALDRDLARVARK